MTPYHQIRHDGEYGTPNIDIEEGWLEVEHKAERTLFCSHARRQIYHTTKVMDTDLFGLPFACGITCY